MLDRSIAITHRKAGEDQLQYLIMKMNDVIITGVVHTGNASQQDATSEIVTIAFAKVEFEYKPQKQDGSPDAGVQFKYDSSTSRIARGVSLRRDKL